MAHTRKQRIGSMEALRAEFPEQDITDYHRVAVNARTESRFYPNQTWCREALGTYTRELREDGHSWHSIRVLQGCIWSLSSLQRFARNAR
jgi:hypothetical protein